MAAFRYLLIGLLAFSPWVASSAFAQSATPLVVSSCGSQTLTATRNASPTVDTTGKLCTSVAASGTTNATIVAPLGTGAPAVGVTVTLDSTDAAALQSILTGVTGAIPAGSALIGKVGIDQTTPGTTNAVVDTATATSGVSTVSKIVANNTTSVALDAAAGTLLAVRVFNNSSTIAYLKLYNAAQGSTTCGSGTPVNRIMIPGQTGGAGAVFVLGGGKGVAYGTAITSCVTTGIADADSTAPAASTYIIEVDVK